MWVPMFAKDTTQWPRYHLTIQGCLEIEVNLMLSKKTENNGSIADSLLTLSTPHHRVPFTLYIMFHHHRATCKCSENIWFLLRTSSSIIETLFILCSPPLFIFNLHDHHYKLFYWLYYVLYSCCTISSHWLEEPPPAHRSLMTTRYVKFTTWPSYKNDASYTFTCFLQNCELEGFVSDKSQNVAATSVKDTTDTTLTTNYDWKQQGISYWWRRRMAHQQNVQQPDCVAYRQGNRHEPWLQHGSEQHYNRVRNFKKPEVS